MSNNVIESTLDAKKLRNSLEEEQETMLTQFREAEDFWSEMRDEALDDLEFSRGEDSDQWDQKEYYARKTRQRPHHTFNRTQPFIDTIVGEHQRSSYNINVAATSFSSAPFKSSQDAEYNQAQAYEAIIRGIERESDAELARNYAFEMGVNCSMGYYSVMPEYRDENSFHQKIGINRIANPLSVLVDPRMLLMGPKKGTYGFIFDTIPRKTLEAKTGMKALSTRQVRGTALDGRYFEDAVRIARYFVIKKRKAELVLLSDGRVYEADHLQKHAKSILTSGVGIIEKRNTTLPQCYSTRIIGGEFEDKLQPFSSKYVPIVPVFGRLKVINGKPQLRSAIRNTKEPAEVYNLMESALVEVIKKAPKTQWRIDWNAVPEKFRKQYARADFDNLHALFYDSEKGQMPQRENPIEAHQGLIQATQRAWENVKGTMGMFQDAFENEGADASGVALRERRGEGESVAYPFIKNFAHGVEFEAELLIDMIPRVFTYQQVLRMPFQDGSEDFLEVNKMQFNGELGKYEFANELTHQNFQVSVDVGPAQKTARQEASDMLKSVLKDVGAVDPRLVPVMMRTIAENSDFPGAQNFSEMISKVIDPIFTEGEDNQEEITPQKVQQMVAQAVNQALEQAGVELEQFRAETDRMEALADRVKANAAQIDANADMIEARKLN